MFVLASYIRPLDTGYSSPSRSAMRYDEASAQGGEFEDGDKIECLYKGKGTKWFSGKISRVNRDGTYDIRYDDGDSESGALKMNVRRHPDAPQKSVAGTSRAGELREGTKVEARYRGKEKYYPGVIRRVNADGTFNIDYDDVSTVSYQSITLA